MEISRRSIRLSTGVAALAAFLALLACTGDGDIQPGVGAAGVRIGDGRAAVERALGKEEGSTSSGVGGQKKVETTYLLYPSRGIDLLLEGDKVRSIFLYSEGVEDHKEYSGTGPGGITLNSKRDQVLAALGEPGARGLGTDADFWLRFDSGLEVAFQPDGTIHHLVVTSPH